LGWTSAGDTAGWQATTTSRPAPAAAAAAAAGKQSLFRVGFIRAS
jgi:hypothetical protein